MRFIHLADLHLGKMLHGVSLIEKSGQNGSQKSDQEDWIDKFLGLADEIRPNAVVIAGDVYDRGLPPGKAAQLLSTMVTRLAELDIPVMITAGNHDSVYHLSFLSPLLEARKVFISKPLDQSTELVHTTLEDEYGPVTFWLLPYVYPAMIAQALGDEEIRDYDTAVRRILAAQPVNFTQRNVLIAHQNVTANGQEAIRGGSESMVGGVGQVDYTAFDGFDYVALGHIHSSYSVGRETVRYAGSPLAYHFNETKQPQKGPLLVTLKGKSGTPVIQRQDIQPLHRLREIRGEYESIRREAAAHPWTNEYLRIILTDTRVSPMIYDFLSETAKAHGSTMMELTSEFNAFTGDAALLESKDMREKPVEALFANFYTERSNGIEPDVRDLELMKYVGEMTRNAEDAQTEPGEKEFQRILDYVLEQEANGK